MYSWVYDRCTMGKYSISQWSMFNVPKKENEGQEMCCFSSSSLLCVRHGRLLQIVKVILKMK